MKGFNLSTGSQPGSGAGAIAAQPINVAGATLSLGGVGSPFGSNGKSPSTQVQNKDQKNGFVPIIISREKGLNNISIVFIKVTKYFLSLVNKETNNTVF